MLRRASPSQRLRLSLSLSRTVMRLSRDGLARRIEGGSSEEVGLGFIALHYGPQLASEVRAHLGARRS
jgi:hypothetical protein